jgi:hypothetical protein
LILQIQNFVIRGAHLARSIIENKCWEGLDRKLMTCELKEDVKVFSFLKVRPHWPSMVQSYGQLKMLGLV